MDNFDLMYAREAALEEVLELLDEEEEGREEVGEEEEDEEEWGEEEEVEEEEGVYLVCVQMCHVI